MADPRFPPVQSGPSKPRGGKIPLLPVILLVIYGLYIGILIIAPALSGDLAETMDGFFPPNFRFIVGGILLGAFALIMLVNLLDTGNKRAPPLRSTGPQGNVKKFKPVQPGQAKVAPPAARTPSPPPQTPAKKPPAPQKQPEPEPPKKNIISYPSEVEGGIYGETFIELGQQKILKLRSLVVEARYLD